MASILFLSGMGDWIFEINFFEIFYFYFFKFFIF